MVWYRHTGTQSVRGSTSVCSPTSSGYSTSTIEVQKSINASTRSVTPYPRGHMGPAQDTTARPKPFSSSYHTSWSTIQMPHNSNAFVNHLPALSLPEQACTRTKSLSQNSTSFSPVRRRARTTKHTSPQSMVSHSPCVSFPATPSRSDQLGSLDIERLAVMQDEDGGWPLAWLCRFGRSKLRIGNRGVVTAYALKVVEYEIGGCVQ
jgi:hypothetical protein